MPLNRLVHGRWAGRSGCTTGEMKCPREGKELPRVVGLNEALHAGSLAVSRRGIGLLTPAAMILPDDDGERHGQRGGKR